ncbi:MAG TPA: hypothetical protein VLA34_14425 [Candidatus Krumholzibacterium sp.]|nr:hypothetical protein [Candidatus Krumholzibacterium sp.]
MKMLTKRLIDFNDARSHIINSTEAPGMVSSISRTALSPFSSLRQSIIVFAPLPAIALDTVSPRDELAPVTRQFFPDNSAFPSV